MSLNEFAYFCHLMEEIGESTETLRTASWGGVSNVKGQSQLELRKAATLRRIEKLQKVLAALHGEIDAMTMKAEPEQGEL